MMKINFDHSYILRNAIFTLTISSSNPNTLQDLTIFGYIMGLDVEAMAVDNLQCVLIDTDYFKKFDFVKFKDANGQTETIELFDSNNKLLGRYEGYELLVHYPENGNIEIVKVICISYDGLLHEFGANVLYGKGTIHTSL